MAGKIFVTGDTHGAKRFSVFDRFNGYRDRFSDASFEEEKDLDREDTVIICGDFGGVWAYDARYSGTKADYLRKTQPYEHGESAEESYDLDWLSKRNATYVFCGGNHENYDRILKAYEEVDFHGGRAMKIRENLFYLEDGYVFNLAGKSIFVMGGARSHDISGGVLDPDKYETKRSFSAARKKLDDGTAPYRIRYISWWDRELPGIEEMERGEKNLKEHGNRVDFVITHCLPTSIQALYSGGAYKRDTLTDYLERIAESTSFPKWFCGHYHDNAQPDERFIIMYEQILRIA